MKRITSLTPEQEALIPVWRARYLERGIATGPCDRPAIEAAMARLYESRSHLPPRLVIWMDSPLGGVFAAGVLAGIVKPTTLGGQLGDQLWGQLYDQLGDQLGGQLYDQLGGQLRGQLGGQLRGQLGGQLGDQLWGQLYDQLGGQLWDQLGGQLRGQLYRSGYGQQDGFWVGWLTFGRHIGAELEPAGGLDALDVLCDAGWWWPFEGAVVLTDRPTVLQRDEQGRLHAEAGPAIAYADGWGIWAWHGVRVPREVIEAPATLTVTAVHAERNVEIRRVMVERMGRERYAAEAAAKVIHSDTDGLGHPRRLLRIERPDDSPMLLVEVVNSTPEPDGHHKTYMVRVPPTVTTCQEGVAWTFGVPAQEYQLAVET